MEQEDFGNIRVGRTSECRKMSEDCGKHQKHQSAEQENDGVWKTSETLETLETQETSEYGIGRHWKHQKHQSVKQEWKFRAEFKIEYGYITPNSNVFVVTNSPQGIFYIILKF